jgi:2'-5' RNA ligase
MKVTRHRKEPATARSSLRLFIAVPTPPEVRARLGELTARLRSTEADVRWEPVEKMHATVKFLGNSPTEGVEALGEALENIAESTTPFPVVYGAIGAFPSMRSPRVLWAGMEDPTGALHNLQQRAEGAFGRLGFPPEERSFHPHVTLGRVRGGRNLPRLLAMVESLTLERQPVELHDILLIKSELKPHGSVYTTLRSAPFLGNRTQRE